MTRRVVLHLGETTTDSECGNCGHLNFRGMECEVFGLLNRARSGERSYSCRAWELSPDSVLVLLNPDAEAIS